VTVAILVATAALEKGRPVVIFATKEAVRLGVPGYAQAIESAGSPPVARLFEQFVDKAGELSSLPALLHRTCPGGEHDPPGARIAGATPLWEWIGREAATVFSY
jgi:hypothetical protein